ncbi:MAG: RNA polymerase sigma factor FliA [Candidatus Margulisbacteria bacterium]|nr:RNA polymerase sigma factor FliA [Candidatus Margulisiibacteriota bacterium]
MMLKNNPYEQDKTSEEIERLVINNLALVKHIISRMEMNLPYGMDREDLVSIGNIGLLEAAQNYDSTKNVQFQTYAYIRVRGAVLDEIRKVSFGGQSIIRKHKKISDAYKTLEQNLGRMPTDNEVAQELGVSEEKFDKLVEETSGAYLMSLDDFTNSEDNLRFIDQLANEEDYLGGIIEQENLDVLVEAIDALPEKDRIILSLYYEQRLSLKEISLIMNLSESRISQVHKKAVISIRLYIQSRI